MLDIKNQVKAKLNFLKKGNQSTMNKDKIYLYPSSILLKQKTFNDKFYSSNNNSTPSLFKSGNNSIKKSINNKYNNNTFNSENYPKKMIKSLSCNSIKLVKSKNKRPLSSTTNNTKNTSTNTKIINSLVNKNDEFKVNDEIDEYNIFNSNYTISIKKSKNRPMSSTLKQSSLKTFNQLIKNTNENKKENIIENIIWDKNKSVKNSRNKNKQYIIKLKNKNENENLRYSTNNDLFQNINIKNSITPSFVKLNSLKNNLFPRTNKNNFSDIKKQTFKSYSMDNPNNNSSKEISKYFFYKDGKSNSVDNIYNANNKNNNNLIHYKNIYYTRKNINNNTFDKIKKYNDAIRIRNDLKNNGLKIEKDKKYSFYKYIEYMDKIEKEELDNYIKDKEKKNIFNIQQIFGDIPSRNKSTKNSLTNKNKNKIKISLNKNNSNENIQNIKINYNQKDEIKTKNNNNNNSNNKFILSTKNSFNKNSFKKNSTKKKSPKKNSPKKNSPKKNSTKINSPKKYSPKKYSPKINSPRRKKQKSRKKRKENDDEYLSSSYTPSDVVINNFDSSKKPKNKDKIENKNKTKTTNNNLIIFEKKRNSFHIDEPKVLLNPEINEQTNRKLTDPNIDQNDKNENNEGIDKNYNNNNDLNYFNYNQQKTNNKETINSGKYNYLRRREKLFILNRRNLMAKQLLLEKIKESEKYLDRKRSSQFIPFFNLKYKHLEDNTKDSQEKILLHKYYKRTKHKFSVRLKNKNSLSYVSSLNSSVNDYMEQYTDIKNIFHDKSFIFKEDEINSDTINKENNEISNNKDNNQNNNNPINSDEKNNYLNEVFNNNSQLDITNNHDNIYNIDDKIEDEFNLEDNKTNSNDNEKMSEFMKLFLEKYRDKIEQKEEVVPEDIFEEINHQFLNIIKENDDIIQSTKKKEEIILFLEFREKMNSLRKFSEKNFNLYILRNYKIILNTLQECKKNKEKEYRINEFLKELNDELNMLYYYKKDISNNMKILNYQPFSSYFKNKK